MPMPTWLIMYGVQINILCIIKIKILVLIKWSYKPSQFMLIIDPIMVNMLF